jgi:SAM-dependent methyltransferase
VGGAVRFTGGSPEQQAFATQALRIDARETRPHVHGFHSYPARLHPATAASAIEALSVPGGSVLDPFCGSGTSLVEAKRLGRHGIGSDLNPLALELCWLKTLAPAEDFLDLLKRASAGCVEFGDDRRLAKAGPLEPYNQATRRAFPIHVLLELDSLQHAVRAVADTRVRRALLLVFSSLLTKVSNQQSDSSKKVVVPRLRSGFTIDLFGKKVTELCEQLRQYRALLPANAPKPKFFERDARQLTVVTSASVDLIVTSPPYPGVFDYLEHHRLRLKFLKLADATFRMREIGARRNYETLDFGAAHARWRAEFVPCLQEMGRVLRPGGHAVLIVADSAVAGQALRADQLLTEWARATPLRVVMTASQQRPNFHGESREAYRSHGRSEHLLLLERAR